MVERNDCACFGAVWLTAADRLFLMRYPNKKSQLPPQTATVIRWRVESPRRVTVFFITRPGNVKIGTIGQNHWNDDVIPFFPQERYNTIEVMMMPNADAIALGKQIKAVRKAMKMTQEQLALKSNVSVKYIANIENGKQNPSFDILSAILHVLPLSLDSVINPNLSEAERECRELESIYFACPPEMRKTLLDATRSLAIHLTELSEQNKNT